MSINFSPTFPSSINYLIIRNPYTPQRIFGSYDNRKALTQEQATECFMRVWNKGLCAVVEDAIRDGEDMPYDAAKTILNNQEQRFLDPHKERRIVKYREFPFLLQFKTVGVDVHEIDQIWFIHSHDSDRHLICVTFKTDEEKQRFHELARMKGYKSGQEFLNDFAHNFLKDNS